jgi:cob(I)alamin adenosyltransferase
MTKIYTKTGDDGNTGLWGGDRIAKDAARIHAYGTVDECNALIGVVRTMLRPDEELDGMLGAIQNRLFVVGADLATPGEKTPAIPRISPEDSVVVEEWIDTLEANLPPLKHFVLPGGTAAAAYLHLARTVCRRAERWTVSLIAADATHKPAAVYLNRLSDFLFVAARYANHMAGVSDHPWENSRRPPKPSP